MSATAYYRAGSYYVDSTDPANPVLWRCMTAGDKASSVWALVSVGGFMGEYDQTKIYSAGKTFMVSSPLTIDSIAVAPGYYGVPPAGTDVNGLPWAGSVPANPTGNAVPQSPLPALGAAPNDKFYAKLIIPFC